MKNGKKIAASYAATHSKLARENKKITKPQITCTEKYDFKILIVIYLHLEFKRNTD